MVWFIFSKGYGCYHPGEKAGFPFARAKAMFKQGIGIIAGPVDEEGREAIEIDAKKEKKLEAEHAAQEVVEAEQALAVAKAKVNLVPKRFRKKES